MTVRRSEPGPCPICGNAVAAGRRKYCGDDCLAAATVEKARKRRDQQQAACKRCKGPKEPGTRGSKYCAECRRVIADSSAAIDYERRRRATIAEYDRKVAAGERLAMRLIDCPPDSKWCSRCAEFRPLTSFPQRKDKKATYCLPCQRGYNRERRVRLMFGLTWDEYELLLACQDYRCAICGGKPRKYVLAVDHCHKTGEIRGLLCSRCNHKLLGSANDDPARLRKAADYLEAFAPRDVFGEARYVPGSGAA